jgi:hypothetical protein
MSVSPAGGRGFFLFLFLSFFLFPFSFFFFFSVNTAVGFVQGTAATAAYWLIHPPTLTSRASNCCMEPHRDIQVPICGGCHRTALWYRDWNVAQL